MTTEAHKPICCEFFGKPKEYYVVRTTVTIPLRPEIGIFRRKKNVMVRLSADKVKK